VLHGHMGNYSWWHMSHYSWCTETISTDGEHRGAAGANALPEPSPWLDTGASPAGGEHMNDQSFMVEPLNKVMVEHRSNQGGSRRVHSPAPFPGFMHERAISERNRNPFLKLCFAARTAGEKAQTPSRVK